MAISEGVLNIWGDKTYCIKCNKYKYYIDEKEEISTE